jgi:hypothetical protein
MQCPYECTFCRPGALRRLRRQGSEAVALSQILWNKEAIFRMTCQVRGEKAALWQHQHTFVLGRLQYSLGKKTAHSLAFKCRVDDGMFDPPVAIRGHMKANFACNCNCTFSEARQKSGFARLANKGHVRWQGDLHWMNSAEPRTVEFSGLSRKNSQWGKYVVWSVKLQYSMNNIWSHCRSLGLSY